MKIECQKSWDRNNRWWMKEKNYNFVCCCPAVVRLVCVCVPLIAAHGLCVCACVCLWAYARCCICHFIANEYDFILYQNIITKQRTMYYIMLLRPQFCVIPQKRILCIDLHALIMPFARCLLQIDDSLRWHLDENVAHVWLQRLNSIISNHSPVIIWWIAARSIIYPVFRLRLIQNRSTIHNSFRI